MDQLNSYMDQNLLILLLDFLKNKDDELFKNKPKHLIVHSFKKRIIIIRNMKIEIKRRYYYDTKNQIYRFLLDENLGLLKYQLIPQQTQKEIQESVFIDKNKFKQICKKYNFTFSKATISAILKKKLGIIYRPNIIDPLNYKNIYVDLDDTFQSVKINNTGVTLRFRIVNFYQKYDKENKKFFNQLKAIFIDFSNSKYYNFFDSNIKLIENIINKNYGNIENFNIYFGGDGARNLKRIAKKFDAKYFLDAWHLVHKNNIVFNIANLKKDLEINKSFNLREQKRYFAKQIKQAIYEGKFDLINSLIQDSKINFKMFPTKVLEIDNYEKYLRNNKESILNWQLYDYCGVYTETFVQQLVKSNFGDVGKIYSFPNFINLLNAKSQVYIL